MKSGRKSLFGVLIAAAVTLSSIAYSQETSGTSEEIEENTSNSWSFDSSAKFVYGITNNAALVDMAEGGDYFQISPKLDAEYEVNPNLYLLGSADADFKRFNNTSVGDIGNSFETKGKFRSFIYLDDFELQPGLKLKYVSDRSPLIDSNGNVIPHDRSYLRPAVFLNSAYYTGPWKFRLGFEGSIQRYGTDGFDIRGNSYKNDFTRFYVFTAARRKLSKNSRIEWKSSFSQKEHLDRMAEFTEGNPAFTGTEHPKLRIASHRHLASFRYKLGKTSSKTSASAKFDKDLVFGARDAFEWQAKQEFTLPMLLSFDLRTIPSASLSQLAFSNFRSEPLNNPEGSDKRTDWKGTASLKLASQLDSNFEVELAYAYQRLLSNYSVMNYVEQKVETGLNLSL